MKFTTRHPVLIRLAALLFLTTPAGSPAFGADFPQGLKEAEVKTVVASTKPKFTKDQVDKRLRELKELLDRGLILREFYDRKVKECEVSP